MWTAGHSKSDRSNLTRTARKGAPLNRLAPRRTFTPARSGATDLLDELDRLRSLVFEPIGSTEVGDWTPALADLEERDDEFVVNVEVPGFDRDNMKIERDGRRLLVHAERDEQESEQEREGTMRASTRSSGHLHHEVVLPAEVDRDGIQASLEQGVLTVRLPKNEQSQRHTIDIR
ncbi:MAG: Hsp20/alpha crystallin family protein [Nitriliruptor sp.]|nr:MAG: Hsp20/alpha crystallin family protein [Nitriliruptor sp.]